VAALWLAMPQAALAGFRQDRTPLPKAVTDGSAGASTIAGGGGVGTIARTVVGLAIVLGVVYGLYWLLKSAGRSRGGDGSGRIELVATTQLAPNRTLHLLRCGDEMILVGAAESGVTPLRVYTHDDAAAAGLLDAEPAGEHTAIMPAPAAVAARSRPRGPVAMLRSWTVRA
jgi:flagellar protein FliO/FliZ